MKNALVAVLLLCVLTLSSCSSSDPELNIKLYDDRYLFSAKLEMHEAFKDIRELNESSNSISFYLQDIVICYDDLYAKRKTKDIKFELFISDQDSLSFIHTLYTKDTEKYFFCEPLLDIYYESNKYVGEKDIQRIKEKILYAIDYYTVDEQTSTLVNNVITT